MIRFEKKQLISATTVLSRTQLAVRFQDIDAAGILFFARIFDYAHAGYEHFLAECGHALPEVIRDARWAAPLRHAEADYLAPCRFGDQLSVELVAASVEETEISLGFRLSKVDPPSHASPSVAVVQTVHTFVSLPSFERRPVPPEIVQKLAVDG